MLHHLSFAVAKIDRAAAFYDAVLAPLGYRRVYVSDNFIGYGTEDNNDKFAVWETPDEVVAPARGFHLAFTAPSRDAVDAFFKAAMRAGGTDRGAPGVREAYGADYYAAFVIDPDGYHIEAVHRGGA